jgi:F0F1-type ATP synthase assembly protein I
MMPLPYRVLVVQTLVAGLITVVLLLVSRTEAVAALLAGITVLVPNAYFAWRVVTLDAGADPERASRRLVFQGVQKQLLMLTSMVVIFVWATPAPWGFFGTLIVLIAIHGLASVLAGPPRRIEKG